jgi:hypothetical protein
MTDAQYRIIEDGNGEYRVEERWLWGWLLWDVTDPFKTIDEARSFKHKQERYDQSVLTDAQIKKRYLKNSKYVRRVVE